MRLTTEQYKEWLTLCKMLRNHYPFVSQLQIERQAHEIMSKILNG